MKVASLKNFSRLLLPLLVLALALVATGCVERRMMIRTNPPGAMVYVDDYPIGVTPCATNFTYYGTRKVRVVKDGYETLTIMQPVPAPWWDTPPLDFFADNLTLNQIRDVRNVEYQLQPLMIVPNEQLLGRAGELRQASRQPAAPPTSSGVLPPRSTLESTTPPSY